MDSESSTEGITYTAVYIATEPGESRLDCLNRLAKERQFLPCGYVYGTTDWLSLPLVDTPCPCGDPNHWLVRWKDTPAIEEVENVASEN